MRVEDPTAIPYVLTAWSARRDDGVWAFWLAYEELPGCIAHGTNPFEALERVEAMREEYLGGLLAEGRPLPEPRIYN